MMTRSAWWNYKDRDGRLPLRFYNILLFLDFFLFILNILSFWILWRRKKLYLQATCILIPVDLNLRRCLAPWGHILLLL